MWAARESSILTRSCADDGEDEVERFWTRMHTKARVPYPGEKPEETNLPGGHRPHRRVDLCRVGVNEDIVALAEVPGRDHFVEGGRGGGRRAARTRGARPCEETTGPHQGSLAAPGGIRPGRAVDFGRGH